jgi:uncharacterized repeat protein (TIGR03803 family)
MKRSTFISLTTLLAGFHISVWASNNKINNDLLAKLNPQVAGLTTNKYSVLYSFQGGADGSNPLASLIGGRDGNGYGTTSGGGNRNDGTVYKITPSGQETVLYSFQGGADGSTPTGQLIQDSEGNLYGTTSEGGSTSNGTVYKITPSGQETVLHSFQGGTTDGNAPLASLIQDSEGNLYGTTCQGGSTNNGTVFKITPSGQETVLYSFQDGSDGSFPVSSLIQDGEGNLYGTTFLGGSTDNGTVFKITPSGQETVLYSFQDGSDGNNPSSGLILGRDGNAYGITHTGGNKNDGTVYKITASGQETVLYSFQGGTDGSAPLGGLVLGSDGNFYGTTLYGGSGASSSCDKVGCGAVFKITPSGQETVLYSFQGGTDGGHPASSLIQDSEGNLYGTTSEGGSNNAGTVFRLTVTP